MKGILALAVTIATVQLTMCQNYDDWIITQETVGQPITLNCSGYCENAADNGCHPRDPAPDGYDQIVSWMGPAPSLHVWAVNSSIPDAQCPTCSIPEGGWQFRIAEFDPEVHIGIYHCMLWNANTSTYYLIKWGVNMRGPYFEDLLAKYEQNIIIGISAFGGFLVVAVTIMLVYKFRWVPENINTVSGQNNYGATNKSGTVNVLDGKVNDAFTADEKMYRNLESPPQYNGVKADVQVHSKFDDEARPGTSGSSSSSSGSESGSVRKRDPDNQGFNFEREETRF